MRGCISITTFSMLILGACGDDGGTTTPIDAPVAVSNVEALACPGGEAAMIVSVDAVNMYTPNAATITTDQVVKFTMSSSHNVVPDTGQDTGLKVNFGETKCLKFTAPGTYTFKCGPHNFKGTITVN